MAGKVNLSFSSFNDKYYWNIMSLCSKNCLKIKFMDLYTLFEGDKAAGKQIFQLLVPEVVDSQQWRFSPSNGRSVLTRCRRLRILVTFNGLNQ